MSAQNGNYHIWETRKAVFSVNGLELFSHKVLDGEKSLAYMKLHARSFVDYQTRDGTG